MYVHVKCKFQSGIVEIPCLYIISIYLCMFAHVLSFPPLTCLEVLPMMLRELGPTNDLTEFLITDPFLITGHNIVNPQQNVYISVLIMHVLSPNILFKLWLFL